MKSFEAFRLDTKNQCLWRDEDRVAIPPKAYDVLRYLVENPSRLVTHDELLEKLWPETYVNPEVVRKYILDVRKILGDRLDRPKFIETMPKRGYRFIAQVRDEAAAEPVSSVSPEAEHEAREGDVRPDPKASEQKTSSARGSLWKLAVLPIVALLAVGGVGAYIGLARTRANAHRLNNPSIAVLPFADMSPGKDQEYFSDGLTEQVIHDLSRVSGLKVVGRSSAFQFRGKNEDLRDMGRKLGVANLLEGSVRREGNHVRVTANLIKADDASQIWSQTYDREIGSIFVLQDEIARSATEALQPKLLGSVAQSISPNLHSANPDAYLAYLQANYLLGRGKGTEELNKALAYADTAIRLDQEYAPTWALRASVQNVMAEENLTDVTAGFRQARNDAERAIALDPTLASAYLALARTQIDYDWDWDTANVCLTKAAALEPGNTEVFRIRSYLFWTFGDIDQAIKQSEKAVALEPLRSDSHLDLGYLLYLAGRYDQARAELHAALDLNPQAAFVHLTLGKILIAEGKPQQALVDIEKESRELGKFTGQALAYHALGHEKDSNAALAGLIAKHDTEAAYQIAEVYAFGGESDQSFEWLERAYKQRDAGLTEIKSDPLLKNLRRDPRYTELLKRMHLPG